MLCSALQNLRLAARGAVTATHKMAPLCNMEQVRNTSVVERMYPCQLAKRGREPRMRPRNDVYRLVERVHDRRTPDITCILTGFVEGVGVRGDQVTVKRSLFRNRLYPAGLAVYVSPENLAMFAEERKAKGLDVDDKALGVFAEMTVKQLGGMYLKVHMSGDNNWILNETHVRVALRTAGVEVGEGCIALPKEPITQPGEFTFQVTVNGAKSVQVKGYILLRHKDPSKDEFVPLPPTWQPTVRTWKLKEKQSGD